MFLYEAELTQQNTVYSELKVKHFKDILKCIIGENIDFNTFILNLNNILVELTNLPLEKILKINVVDYFLLLAYIRTTSIGSSIMAEVPHNDTKLKVSININKIIETIKNIQYKDSLVTETINGINISYKLPTPHELLYLDTTDIETFCIPFIENVSFIKKKTTTIISDLPFETKKEIIKKIPAKIITSVYKKIYSVLERFAKANLLEHMPAVNNEIQQIPFTFNAKSYISLLAFLFNNQLFSLYDNIFILTKIGNFTPEYVENCTPGELIIYIKKLEEFIAKKQKQPSNNYNIPTEEPENNLG